MTNRERISGVDTAWLRMEHPTNPMMVVGVMMFERPLHAADVKLVIERRFLAFRRFRQRAVLDSGGAWWESDPSLDLDAHIHSVRLALMGSDAQTRFKGPLSARKRAAWADPLPLDEVKAVGKALGCSINDVLLSMAAGALRDYLADKADAVDGLEIRVIVPVNLRPAGEGRGLGNHFGLVFLDLPIGMDHPLERLYEVRRRMQALKGSYQPIIALGLLNAVGYGPRAIQEKVTALLGNSASAVVTNVPGPQHPLYFAGQRITELDFWVPQSGGIGMGVSILSYDGRIQFGLVTDAGLVPDPQRIVARFADEFDKLMWLTLMSPWAPAEAGPDPPPSSKIPKRFRTL